MLQWAKKTILNMIPVSLAGRLRTWRLQKFIRSYQSRVVEHRYGAERFKVILSDPLAEGWYDHDWPVLPEIAELRKTSLRLGAKVFDLGAHQGVVALMLAHEVGVEGHVLALEPNPHNAAAAEKNRNMNGMSQLQIMQAAVSNHTGQLVFNEGLNGQIDDGSGRLGRITVECTTINDLVNKFGKPDLVFLDVEGAECLALEGASQLFGSRVDFFVEAHVGHGLETMGGSIDTLLSYFPRERFELLVRSESDEQFRPLTVEDPITRDRFFLLAINRDQ